MDVGTAARFPVRLTESGPAGGATAASYLGLAAGMPNLIAYDMGGTTAKICLIDDGKPLALRMAAAPTLRPTRTI